MKRQKVVPFQWKPLSPKQAFILSWWIDEEYSQYDAIIADGSVRSGKTVSMSMSYINWAMTTFDENNFGMSGKTIQSLRRNVITPVQRMMLGRGYRVKDNKSENRMEVYNPRNGHTNTFYFFGGKDEGSQDLIQGITLAGMFFDEVALMPESFVNQAVARCSVHGAKFWFNCNPDHPSHWFHKNWIEKLSQKRAMRVRFRMEDNWSLSKETMERYKRLYSGIFYMRFILGEWVAGDGVIYDMFNEEQHVVEKGEEPFKLKNSDRIIISADIGTQNATTFGLYGVKAAKHLIDSVDGVEMASPLKNHYHLFDAYYHSGRETRRQKTNKQYVDDLIEFIEENGLRPEDIEYVIVDPAAADFIAELNTRTKWNPYKGVYEQLFNVIRARNKVDEGIATVMNHLDHNLFTMTRSKRTQTDIDEFYSYQWDEDKLDRGLEVPKKVNDHCMDRTRYAILTDTKVGGRPRIYSGKGARI